VTEIMLTLEAAVDNLDVNLRPLVKELFMSTPNLAKDPTLYQIPASNAPIVCKSSTMAPHAQLLPTLSTHLRSTSYNLAAVARKAVVSSPPVLEHKGFHVILHLFVSHLRICIVSNFFPVFLSTFLQCYNLSM
jgi:hypothetical protein